MTISPTWWHRLTGGLKRSSSQIGGKLKAALFHKQINTQTLDELEEILIQADMGVSIASSIRNHLASMKFETATAHEQVITELMALIEAKLKKVEQPLVINSGQGLQVVLMIGVNGAGKTTTLAKFANQWIDQGLKVEIAACDTFRAAATEQLQVWADRVGVFAYTSSPGHDPSGLAFDAIQKALKKETDVLIIDTAGRLQNKEHLMHELQKMQRVIQKIIPQGPQHVILTLDATTGQNALTQTRLFLEGASVTGLVITKLDGTAKGGVVVAIAEQFNLPIHAIGVGETVDDLQPFMAFEFTRALLGVNVE